MIRNAINWWEFKNIFFGFGKTILVDFKCQTNKMLEHKNSDKANNDAWPSVWRFINEYERKEKNNKLANSEWMFFFGETSRYITNEHFHFPDLLFVLDIDVDIKIMILTSGKIITTFEKTVKATKHRIFLADPVYVSYIFFYVFSSLFRSVITSLAAINKNDETPNLQNSVDIISF